MFGPKALWAAFAFGSVMAVPVTQAQTADLTVTFADPAWDGTKIPKGQHCKKFGGEGATPALTVANIPAEANAIVLEFNDKSYQQLSYDGGHGRIGFHITPGTDTATLPSVPGGTNDMPDGVWLIKKNRATGAWTSPGYLPPCSGGRGNIYEADVFAVIVEGDDYKEIAESTIKLGRY